jgi:succinate-semialdehyde dehydrogenase / glutarate-semialdehyde dehydrogenase
MKEFIITNPANLMTYAKFSTISAAELADILNKTSAAQQTWAKTALSKRQECCRNLGQALLAGIDEYAATITAEMGKPISQARAELEKCAAACDFYCEHAPEFLSYEVKNIQNYKAYNVLKPSGTILGVMPWNYPFWQVFRFAIPNLMLGNAILLKHAPNSWQSAQAIEELMLVAGFPRDLFRALFIDVAQVEDVIKHPSVAGVSLTGSASAGRQVASLAGANLKKVVLELGGSDPCIILPDADLDLAAKMAVSSRLTNCGQVCIAAKRLIIVEAVYEDFAALLLEQVKSYVMADPMLETTMLGPMARDDLRQTLHSQVMRSIASGAKLLVGGFIPDLKGFYYPATVLGEVTETNVVFQEELFGPVCSLIKAKNTEHAIYLANNTSFGLGAAVFTQDLVQGERIARDELEAGNCAVNTTVSSNFALPFGGTKQSGFGRELSLAGMLEFANQKTVVCA